MALKLCIDCKLEKEACADFFSKNVKYPDKLQPRCIPCHKIYAKKIRDNAPRREANTDPTVLKICQKCGVEMAATVANFHRHSKMPDGLQKSCIACALKWSKRYYNEYPAPRSRQAEYLTDVSRVRRANPELYAADRARTRELYIELRTEVLRHYSNNTMSCACCGMTGYKFLSIDHINNDGAEHREEVSSGFDYIRWFFKHEFPEGFQILCYNCNCSKGFHKGCPHNDPDDPDYIIRDAS